VKEHRLEKGLTQDQLARKADVPYTTLTKIECGVIRNPSVGVLTKIARALSKSIDDLGGVETYLGENAVKKIWDDVLQTLQPGDCMLISGIAPERYLTAERNGVLRFIENVRAQGFSQKLLGSEGDITPLLGERLEYRWIPKQYLSPIPIYVYGDKLATLHWGPPQRAMITWNPSVAEAYRRQFMFVWENAAKF
jgi:transcriptional regulator with XRE-family HTH domain